MIVNEKIQIAIDEIAGKIPSNIGIMFGYKTVNKEITDELGFIFSVKEKIEESKLNPNEILPKKIQIEDREYVTDVIEIKKNMILSTAANVTYQVYSCNKQIPLTGYIRVLDTDPIQIGDLITCTDGFCYYVSSVASSSISPTLIWSGLIFNHNFSGCDNCCNQNSVLTNCYNWQPLGSLIPPNRNTWRPIIGGVSLTSSNHQNTIGTLGFLAIDNETNSIVGVTNNHVVIKDAFYTAERNLRYPVFDNENGDLVYQNGESINPTPDKIIGEVIRYVPLYRRRTNENSVDCALVSIKGEFINNQYDPQNPEQTSWNQLGLTGITSPMQFATTNEINSIFSYGGVNLRSTGRTSGAKQDCCSLQPYALNARLELGGYNLQGFGEEVLFKKLIVFTRKRYSGLPSNTYDTYPVYPGDSGSALIADFPNSNGVGTTPKIIGLIFALGDGVLGYACRIDEVAKQLNISAWDGTIHPQIDLDNKKLFTLEGGSFDKTLICSGETYWQAGLTDTINQECNCEVVKMTFTATTNTTVGFFIQGSANFNMIVDWGDGNTTTYNGSSSYSTTHTYTTSGTYVAQIGVSDCSLITNFSLNGRPGLIAPLTDISGLGNFSNLLYIYMSYTSLTNFDPESILSSNLNTIVLNHNLFTSFNPTLPLPNSLNILSLTGNKITSFNPTLALPTSLRILNIDENLFTSFNPTLPLPSTLFQLVLSNNLLTSFNPTQPLPTLLTILLLDNNNLNTNNVNITLDTLSNVTWTSIPPRRVNVMQNPVAPPSVGPPNGIQAKANLQAVGWTVQTD